MLNEWRFSSSLFTFHSLHFFFSFFHFFPFSFFLFTFFFLLLLWEGREFLQSYDSTTSSKADPVFCTWRRYHPRPRRSHSGWMPRALQVLKSLQVGRGPERGMSNRENAPIKLGMPLCSSTVLAAPSMRGSQHHCYPSHALLRHHRSSPAPLDLTRHHHDMMIRSGVWWRREGAITSPLWPLHFSVQHANCDSWSVFFYNFFFVFHFSSSFSIFFLFIFSFPFCVCCKNTEESDFQSNCGTEARWPSFSFVKKTSIISQYLPCYIVWKWTGLARLAIQHSSSWLMSQLV